jgi:hypothetical protein
METPFLDTIITTTQAVLANIQVSFVERSVVDVNLTYLLDCYQTQRRLCSAFGTNPQIADCNCDSSYQIRCRWGNAYRGAASYWETHRVLFWFIHNLPYTDKGYQDSSQNLCVCGGPTKGQQSEKLLSPGCNEHTAQRLSSWITTML